MEYNSGRQSGNSSGSGNQRRLPPALIFDDAAMDEEVRALIDLPAAPPSSPTQEEGPRRGPVSPATAIHMAVNTPHGSTDRFQVELVRDGLMPSRLHLFRYTMEQVEAARKLLRTMIELFMCVICYDAILFESPFSMCHLGHIICGSCAQAYKAASTCAYCRGLPALPVASNHFLIRQLHALLSENATLACPFQTYGCSIRALGVDLPQHIRECPLREIPCPRRGCQDKKPWSMVRANLSSPCYKVLYAYTLNQGWDLAVPLSAVFCPDSGLFLKEHSTLPPAHLLLCHQVLPLSHNKSVHLQLALRFESTSGSDIVFTTIFLKNRSEACAVEKQQRVLMRCVLAAQYQHAESKTCLPQFVNDVDDTLTQHGHFAMSLARDWYTHAHQNTAPFACRKCGSGEPHFHLQLSLRTAPAHDFD